MRIAERMKDLFAIVVQASEIMVDATPTSADVSGKEGNGNYVTRYDVATQEYLVSHLAALFPEAEFFAEEKENGALTDAPTFIIDPIDGTTNFILDMRHSCISVALCVEKQAVLGIVYDPYQKELFYALRGQGAYLRREGREWPLSVGSPAPCDALVIFGTDPYRKKYTGHLTSALFRASLDTFMDLRRIGSAALDLVYVAAGRAHGFFEGMLSPWDYAAGGLILAEAGGVMTDEKGNFPAYVKSPIFAGTATVHRALMETVLPAARAELGGELPFYEN